MRARVLLFGAVIATFFLACGNDFDALFEGAGAGSDAGGTNVDAGGDTGPASGDPSQTCGLPAAKCGPQNTCAETKCSHVCGGCRCACERYDCPETDGIKSCSADCEDGATCEVRCGLPTCTLTAHRSVGTFVCDGNAGSLCDVVCDLGSICKVLCDNEGPCDVACIGASCTLTCTPKATSCNLDCGGTPGTTCADGTKVCGTCPP